MQKLKVNYNPKYTFTNFNVTAENKEAYIIVSSILNKPIDLVFLHGNTGKGKTHLLISLTNQLLEKNPSLSVIYVSMADFLKDFVLSLRTKTEKRFIVKYRKAEYLIFDDIDILEGKPETQNEFIRILNYRNIYGKTTLISCTSDAGNINLVDKLKSRLKWGLDVTIQ